MSQSNQVIKLPQGGGAMQGIGETFAPDLHTGTGNFSVPIALPPGRNGFQPQVSLAYSTGTGNGPFGLGWSPGIPGVSRKTSRGVPRYDDARDTFLLSGAEDLVAMPGATPAVTRYRPRTEGLFAQIAHHRDASGDCWQVRSKDGLISMYGAPDSQAEPATISDPAQPGHIFAWKLTSTTDRFGNRILYRYERDATRTDGPHQWDQLYLSEIRYIDYGDSVDPQFLAAVHFSYEDRPDRFSDHRAGFEIRTVRRCRQIDVTIGGQLVRTYELGYLPPDPSRPNGLSLLGRITLVGVDGAQRESLPPLSFAYTAFAQDRRRFTPVTGAALPATALVGSGFDLVDLHGCGLPDIVELNGAVRVWRNLGGGRFDWPRSMEEAPSLLGRAGVGTQLIDANGDGRIDLLVTDAELPGYFPLGADGRWDRRSFRPYRAAPSFSLQDPEVRLVDLDGDRVTDAIRSGSRMECFFNDPHDGWRADRSRMVERQQLANFPDVAFSDPRVQRADMTGDGLHDIVLVEARRIAYWPNLGHGDWGRRVAMRDCPQLPDDFDPRRVLLGDIDGDELADLVYVDHGRVLLWINQSGNGWSAPIVIGGTPAVSDMDTVRLVDLDGAGVSGLLWSADADGTGHPTMRFLDFIGGRKPYLLCEMDNHLGAVTRITYAPSTRDYLADQARPATRWRTPLPFPVQVVARVEKIDRISNSTLTTEYRYHHGYWDGTEREFRGFGRVDQYDAETFTEAPAGFAPPTLTKTWFHLGPVGEALGDWTELDYRDEYWPGDPPALARPAALADFLTSLPRRAQRDALRALRGSVLRTELYALDGTGRQERPYTVTETLHGVREEARPGQSEADRNRIFFPHLLAQRTTQWERGDDAMTQVTFSEDYDAYGHPRMQIAVAVPRGRDYRRTSAAGEPYLATQTVTDYADRDDTERYLVGRAARVTSYEIVHDGVPSLFALRERILAGAVLRRIIGQTLTFYDGAAFVGLPFGQLGAHGVVARTEHLVLTEAILAEAYRSGETAQMPPYLVTDGAPPWTDEYPQEFRDRTPALAGYLFHPGGDGSEYARGYFVAAERRGYDCQERADGKGRGLLLATRDPLGRETTIAYEDGYELLPTAVADAAGLITRASYDHRVLQPCEVTDANGNRSAYRFTPLGLLERSVVMGKPGEPAGDTLDAPGTRLIYDFLAFAERSQPVAVRTIRRVYHAGDPAVPLPERDETIEEVKYSDGFGRLLQTRAQAEDVTFGNSSFGDAGLPADQALPGGDATGRPRAAGEVPRVVVSGWKVYDNKGRVVEQYEPFFAAGWAFQPEAEAKRGQHATLFYDPRGQVIRTVNADGSEQRVVFGVPQNLADPHQLTPTPWEAYTYDANDNAGRTHPQAASGYQHHWNTPTSIVVDALGRTITAVARSGPDPATGWLVTRSAYDIQGNLLTVTDALERVAFRHVYDLAKRLLRIDSIDAGVRRSVHDAAGQVVEGRDGKGALVLHAYDAVNRPVRRWARDGGGKAPTLRERLVYGDAPEAGLTLGQAAAANLLGKPYRSYDEAGLVAVAAYDFKGNVLEKTRQVIGDAALLASFASPPPDWQVPAFRVDWQPPEGTALEQHASGLLDATAYRTTLAYDALSRVTMLRCPQDVTGARKELRPRYDRAAALERVELDGAVFVERIAYNAKGQRTLIAYGNGVMTRHAYDPRTFRLLRLRSERYTTPAELIYHPAGAPLQDLAYAYDLAGNITAIRDRAPESGVPNTSLGVDALDRAFAYDPLYRLIEASGRESDRPPPPPPWDEAPRGDDPTRTRAYAERYDYDAVGNLLRLQHQAAGGSFTRTLAVVPGSNRLATVTIGETSHAYAHDANGNLRSEATSRHFEWDAADRMRVYRTQAGAAEPSVHAQYLYDAGGQRVKKLVRKQGGRVEVTIYVDGVFEHQRVIQGGAAQENNTLHVMDGQSRIALVRIGVPFPDDATPAVQHHLGDHLGSSSLVLDDHGGWINREEYSPYGETSFGSFARKRYRFTGKERDEESGLAYHGARYYAPWLARWASCDPAGTVDGLNLYVYVRGNSLRYRDSKGLQSQESTSQPLTEQAAQAAAMYVQQEIAVHIFKIWIWGSGSSGGTRSGEFTHAEIARMNKGENVTNASGIKPTNCTELPLAAAGVYFDMLGQAELGAVIRKESRDSRGPVQGKPGNGVESARMTAFIRQLHKKADFSTAYISLSPPALNLSPQAVRRTGAYPARAACVVGADTGKAICDVRAPVDRVYATHGGTTQSRAEARQMLQELEETPFAVGTVDGGSHAFVIAQGRAYEVHWRAASDSVNVYEESTVQEFLKQYSSAVIAFPPRQPLQVAPPP